MIYKLAHTRTCTSCQARHSSATMQQNPPLWICINLPFTCDYLHCPSPALHLSAQRLQLSQFEWVFRHGSPLLQCPLTVTITRKNMAKYEALSRLCTMNAVREIPSIGMNNIDRILPCINIGSFDKFGTFLARQSILPFIQKWSQWLHTPRKKWGPKNWVCNGKFFVWLFLNPSYKWNMIAKEFPLIQHRRYKSSVFEVNPQYCLSCNCGLIVHVSWCLYLSLKWTHFRLKYRHNLTVIGLHQGQHNLPNIIHENMHNKITSNTRSHAVPHIHNILHTQLPTDEAFTTESYISK